MISITDKIKMAKEKAEQNKPEQNEPQQKSTSSGNVIGQVVNDERGKSMNKMKRVAIVSVNPSVCRPWAVHDRDDSWFTEKRSKSLLDSIRINGQKYPALARKISGDEYEYEIIAGMRRRWVCEQLGRPLDIKIIEGDDKSISLEMHIENQEREDLTPTEEAISYYRLIQHGVYANYDELSAHWGISKSKISKGIKAATVLDEPHIKDILTDPTSLSVSTLGKLANLMSNADNKKVIIKSAKNLKNQTKTKPSKECLDVLINSVVASKKETFKEVNEKVRVGDTQCSIKRNTKGKVSIAFDAFNELSTDDFSALFDDVKKALK